MEPVLLKECDLEHKGVKNLRILGLIVASPLSPTSSNKCETAVRGLSNFWLDWIVFLCDFPFYIYHGVLERL